MRTLNCMFSFCLAISCFLAGGVRGQEQTSAPSPTEAPYEVGGKPIPYNWALSSLESLGEDAARFEAEMSELINSPLSDWQVQPTEGEPYTAAVRPITTEGVPDVVVFLSAEYNTSGGRAFFEFLVSEEGFDLIDPFTEGNNQTYDTPVRAIGPNGAEVYANAQVTDLGPNVEGIFLTAFHFQECGDRDLEFYNYPALVPFEARRPIVQQATGTLPEISTAYGFKIKQTDEATIQMDSIAWLYLPPGAPLSLEMRVTGTTEFLAGVDERIREHLAAVEYPAASDDDSGTMCMPHRHGTPASGMYGAYGA